MKNRIKLQNIKCGGCVNTIEKKISSIDGVNSFTVEDDKIHVSYEVTDEQVDVLVKSTLSKLGYPQVGDDNTVLHKGKSFVSCAIGRLDNQVNR